MHDLRGLEVDAANIIYVQLPITGALDILDILDILDSPPSFCTPKRLTTALGCFGLSLTCLTAPLANNHSRVVSRLWLLHLRDSSM